MSKVIAVGFVAGGWRCVVQSRYVFWQVFCGVQAQDVPQLQAGPQSQAAPQFVAAVALHWQFGPHEQVGPQAQDGLVLWSVMGTSWVSVLVETHVSRICRLAERTQNYQFLPN